MTKKQALIIYAVIIFLASSLFYYEYQIMKLEYEVDKKEHTIRLYKTILSIRPDNSMHYPCVKCGYDNEINILRFSDTLQ